MLSLVVAAVCLVGSVFAQLPPSYTLAHTNTTLGVKYGSLAVKPGATLGYKGKLKISQIPSISDEFREKLTFCPLPVPSEAPILTSPISLNSTYIAMAVDTTANLSAPIPAELLWFQQDVTFSSAGIASTNTTAQVPYLAPFNVGHAYVVLLYTQPPGFMVPPDFPYTATFRAGFNVSRTAVDFKTPLLEANWFVLGSKCTEVKATPTGLLPSGTGRPSGGARGRGMKGGYPRSGLKLRG